ncbi:family 78 glycoside hydrolase catalytic domain [Arthrobacter sp. ZGTC412]|uniref:family 78 glycoside hydrolase catalytic domain n=1 Tax=Arthrobacter sp. ZGTC412 TaxID=2058900 RepID=UPI002158578A|nr:family 78 glycoside hydrolase catalytic domain [Arthrobacter sp. ZGTC412]
MSIRAGQAKAIAGPCPDEPGPLIAKILGDSGKTRSHAEYPISITSSADSWLYLELDFGKIVAGFVRLDVEAPEGTILDLHYRERPLSPSAPAPTGAEGMRYIARGSGDTYESLELAGLRYIYLTVRAPHAATVTINRVDVREHTYPWQGEAAFQSNDAQLDALFLAGIRTVQLNSFDAFTDCPTRELRSWVGDGVVHQMVHLTTNADWRLARQYVQLADSPRPDGLLPMSVAGDIEHSGTFTIPDYSLHWIHAVHNVFIYAGVEAAQPHLPTVERILRWFAAYTDPHGTLSDLPEWNLVDWSSIFTTGRSSILTALWGRALLEFADMSTQSENSGSARWALQQWEAAKEGFESFWDENRGTYIDHILEDNPQPAASQAAGAAAIIAGFVPAHRLNRVAEVITDPRSLVVRSWIGGDDGDYDEERIDQQAKGIQYIDWDVHREIVRAQPFFSYVVHDALAAAGRTDLIIKGLRSWQQFLQDGYDTFGECWGWGTTVHGWSATPARDLVQHILGVTPYRPGFQTVRIAPRLGGLKAARGVVPSPAGAISVAVNAAQLEINSPLPIVVVREDNEEIHLPAGTHTVSMA